MHIRSLAAGMGRGMHSAREWAAQFWASPTTDVRGKATTPSPPAPAPWLPRSAGSDGPAPLAQARAQASAALRAAVDAGDAEAVTRLIGAGADPNAVFESPAAARSGGDPPCSRADAGSPAAGAQRRIGAWTVLHTAAADARPDALPSLLRGGPDVAAAPVSWLRVLCSCAPLPLRRELAHCG